MIFKKLGLKNFMSYANAEIDFSGIHVACLVGPNGAGKSSLLDAITWTLWEEGRARTDELLKLGTNEMTCELEFFMEDELYRVYRSRTKSFKNIQGKSNLEFQIFNPKEKMWTSLSMTAVRQTQDRITKTLKMDYKTFVNSVYLRQGKADEFTIKRPNERKQILSEILGLEVYDNLCDKARSRVKDIDQNIGLEQSLISSLKEKLETEDTLKQNLTAYTSELKDKEEELSKIKDSLKLKEKELNEKKEKEKQIQILERSKQNQESLIKTLEEQLKSTKQKEEKYKELISKKAQITDSYSKYIQLKKDFDVLEKKKDEQDKLVSEKSALELELKHKKSEIEQKLAVYESRLNDRSALKIDLLNRLTLESKLTQFSKKVESEIEEFSRLQKEFKEAETKGLELKHSQSLLESEVSQIEKKEKEISEKIKVLNTHDHTLPCPLCKSQIKDKEKVISSYEAELATCEKEKQELIKVIGLKEKEIKEKRDEYSTIKEKIGSFNKVVSTLLPELEEIRKEKIRVAVLEKIDSTKAVSFLESQLEVTKSEFQKLKEKCSDLDKEICDYKEKIVQFEHELKDGVLIQEVNEKLNLVLSGITSLEYNPGEFEKLKTKLKENEGIVLTYSTLREAESEISTLSNEAKNLALRTHSATCEVNELKSLIIENKKQIEDIALLEKEVHNIRENEHLASNNVEKIRKEVIVCEQTLIDIENSKSLIKGKEDKIQKFLNDKKYFEILERAFSKNGIPVAIIETVVPEIEKEANRILNRLTDNQMHVALKTQREKKSEAGLIETLDVVIADNLGTRNYELYSGGEAFKIDFSLRLALSRLLANRSGAKLQTLIIDEGFGSQDSSGKERLLEVIRSVDTEFELVLVVTHLDELKESFPVQINVSKDENGSVISLLS